MTVEKFKHCLSKKEIDENIKKGLLPSEVRSLSENTIQSPLELMGILFSTTFSGIHIYEFKSKNDYIFLITDFFLIIINNETKEQKIIPLEYVEKYEYKEVVKSDGKFLGYDLRIKIKDCYSYTNSLMLSYYESQNKEAFDTLGEFHEYNNEKLEKYKLYMKYINTSIENIIERANSKISEKEKMKIVEMTMKNAEIRQKKEKFIDFIIPTVGWGFIIAFFGLIVWFMTSPAFTPFAIVYIIIAFTIFIFSL